MTLFARLRSRRLAIWLLVGLTAYAWVTTLVPLESVDPAGVTRWDAEHPLLAAIAGPLGLHRAYSSPVFVAAALLLTLSTALCAWERTRDALREWRDRGLVSEPMVRRIEQSPSFSLPVEGADAASAFEVATSALARSGLRVRSGARFAEARGNTIGLLGSPLFHWALVGLFVFAALGQLTRHEGFVNVLIGRSVPDVRESYELLLNAGPLAGAGFTGLEVGVQDVELDFERDGIARGGTPLVTLADGGRVIKRQWVFPNSPLTQGPIVIHRGEVGPAFVGTVTASDGRPAEQVVLYYKLGDLAPRQFSVLGSDAQTVTVSVAPVEGGRVAIGTTAANAATRTVGPGARVPISVGATLTVDSLDGYAQLKVVSDWSVPWIYAMFALGTLGAALTVFLPPRTVRLRLLVGMEGAPNDTRSASEQRASINVIVTARNNDPGFAGRVRRGLESALATRPDVRPTGVTPQ